jgi:uncharacterized protein (TIGR02246 family)
MEEFVVTAVRRPDTDAHSIEAVIGGLVKAWNKGDALGFAGYFQEDADLVNIHGMYLHGRQSIAGLYDMLFRSIFADSSTSAKISAKRFLNKTTAIVHALVEVESPRGAMAGRHDALTSLLLVRDGPHWQIAAQHNTLVSKPLA